MGDDPAILLDDPNVADASAEAVGREASPAPFVPAGRGVSASVDLDQPFQVFFSCGTEQKRVHHAAARRSKRMFSSRSAGT
jgi:hypothetical protein